MKLFLNVYLLNKIAKDKNIEINIISSEGTIVRCDRNMTMTVVRNLLDNVIKFSNPYSEIIIDCKLEIDDPNREYYQISVSDNGDGIPESNDWFI